MKKIKVSTNFAAVQIAQEQMKLLLISSKQKYSNSFFKITSILILILIFSCSNSDEPDLELRVKDFPNRVQDFSMWQLEPFFQETQMGYIIKTDDNQIIVIDGGGFSAAPYLESYLRQLGGTVNTWIITHGHLDHMGALIEIIDSKAIVIERLIHAPPTLDWALKNEASSKSTFTRYINSIQNAKLSELIPENEEELFLGDGVRMEILSAGNSEIVQNAINNSSLVFRISSKSKSILFLGDMGIEGGQKILQSPAVEKLKAEYVQMSHHGQQGVDKEFYDAVQADYALWPTPNWLWENRADGKGRNTGDYKTLIVREWMEDLGITKNYVSGLEGTVQID